MYIYIYIHIFSSANEATAGSGRAGERARRVGERAQSAQEAKKLVTGCGRKMVSGGGASPWAATVNAEGGGAFTVRTVEGSG